MCLAIPAQILEIDPVADNALVSLGGVRRPVSLALIEDAEVGDFVLVHVGYALNKISAEEAERTLDMMREIGELAELEPGLEPTQEPAQEPFQEPAQAADPTTTNLEPSR
jgi:hydrogenase expression/formation protein HypC